MVCNVVLRRWGLGMNCFELKDKSLTLVDTEPYVPDNCFYLRQQNPKY